MDHVFIVGVARTGSKIYRNIINHNTNINILNELHYKSPRWIRKDFIHSTRKSRNQALQDKDVRSFVDFLYSKKLIGTFWKTENWNGDQNPNNISGINRDELRKELERSGLDYENILRVIIEKHTNNLAKSTGGAKFPMEISCTPLLREWFPGCKIIQITRDPRGIYASMIYGDFKDRKSPSWIMKIMIRGFRLFYLYNQYNKAYKINKSFQMDERYLLYRFEDIVTEPEKTIRSLCTFLGVDFDQEMLFPPVVNSSFGSSKEKKGLDGKAASRWKQKLSGFDIWIVKSLLRKQMKGLGYEL